MVIECGLRLAGTCNYGCWYCTPYPEKRPKTPTLMDMDRVREAYNILRDRNCFVVTQTYARGTEPALHPQIVGLMDLAAAVGGSLIRTNMSIPIERWLPKKPEHVCLIASLHPEAERDLDGFVGRVLEARDAGVTIEVKFVAVPGRDWRTIRKMCDAQGIQFRFSEYKGQGYPGAYTLSERQGFDFLLDHSPPVKRQPGDLCIAGWQAVHIDDVGIVRRCKSRPPITKLASRAEPCSRSSCGGLRAHNTVRFSPWFLYYAALLEAQCLMTKLS